MPCVDNNLSSINRLEPFSESIKTFLMHLGRISWDTAIPSAVFLRDFEQLPFASPHDVDLLIDAAEQGAFVNELNALAVKFGLGVSSKLAGDVCFVLIADLEAGAEGRPWVYFEVRAEINYATSYCLKSTSIERKDTHELGIPVPSLAWQVMLSHLHSLRSGKPPKVNTDLAQNHLGLMEEVSKLMRDELGVDVKFGRSVYEIDRESAALLHSLVRKKKGKSLPKRSLKSKINNFAISNFYAYPLGADFVYTLHGPDGVGKTTACENISSVFRRMPIRFNSFHHITGWKYDDKRKSCDGGERINKNVSFLHLFARSVYRVLPDYLKKLYVLVSGFHHYLRKLNSKIFENRCVGGITMIDRYVYDMAAKNLISGVGPKLINLVFCKMMKKPRISFVLRDEPENILKRKQELSAEEIRVYSHLMENLVPRKNYYEVNVTGKTPKEVSHEIMCQILQSCGPHLTYLLEDHKKAVGSDEC